MEVLYILPLLFLFNYNMALIRCYFPHLFFALINEEVKYLSKCLTHWSSKIILIPLASVTWCQGISQGPIHQTFGLADCSKAWQNFNDLAKGLYRLIWLQILSKGLYG